MTSSYLITLRKKLKRLLLTAERCCLLIFFYVTHVLSGMETNVSTVHFFYILETSGSYLIYLNTYWSVICIYVLGFNFLSILSTYICVFHDIE